jgi:hypothetical protein
LTYQAPGATLGLERPTVPKDYSAIRHLAMSLFGEDWGEGVICVWDSHHFTCYWDDSGTDPGTETVSKSDRPILLVGGYLAHVDEWLTFGREWKPIIQPIMERFPNVRYFHMVDFANRNYPYNKLTDDECEALLESLLELIHKHARLSIAWAINTDAYMEIIKARNLLDKDIVRAFHICARKCMESVALWAHIGKHGGKILHIFDQGNSAWFSFEESCDQRMLDAFNILRPISQSKADILPLQAADILAHQRARALLISEGRTKPGRRLYMDQLSSKLPGYFNYVDVPDLKRLYDEELMLDLLRSGTVFPGVTAVRDFQNTDTFRKSEMYLKEMFSTPEEFDKFRQYFQEQPR